jgi:hypothetical protein
MGLRFYLDGPKQIAGVDQTTPKSASNVINEHHQLRVISTTRYLKLGLDLDHESKIRSNSRWTWTPWLRR